MKITKAMALLALMVLFVMGGCIGGNGTDNAEQASDVAEQDVDTPVSDDSDEEYDPDPTDINYDHFDAGIPNGFPEVIPVYNIENSTVLGGMEQDAGGTLVYSLVLGTDDQISNVSDVITGSLENIDMNIAVEGSTMLMGYMGDWDYTITVDNGDADGYTTIITYSIVEKK